MTTQNKSRLLLTVLVAPPIAFSLYLIFAGLPIWGLSILVGGCALLAWIWWPKHPEKKES